MSFSNSWCPDGSQDSQPLVGFIGWWEAGLGWRCTTEPGGLSRAFWHRTMCPCHQGKYEFGLKMFPPVVFFVCLCVCTTPLLTAAPFFFLLHRVSPQGGTTGRWTWETKQRGMWVWLDSQWAEREWSRWLQRMAIGPYVWGGAVSTGHVQGRQSCCISSRGPGLWVCSSTMKMGQCLSLMQRLIPTCILLQIFHSPRPSFRFSTRT